VILAWIWQQGVVTHPRTANPAHMLENLQAVGGSNPLKLTQAEVCVIDPPPHTHTHTHTHTLTTRQKAAFNATLADTLHDATPFYPPHTHTHTLCAQPQR
jgi:hypothetical protein